MRRYKEETVGLRSGTLIRRPVTRNRWKTVRKGIYNPNSNKILGRTKRSWWQLSLFYSVFLVILFTMFAVCMWALFSTLDNQRPKYILEDSLIGTNPGLGFRPMSPDLKDGSLIWYSLTNKKSFEKFTKTLDAFLRSYSNQTAKNFIDCNFKKYPKGDEVCKVDMNEFGVCDKKISKYYGYDDGEPCVFIKLNKIFGWKPNSYHRPQPDMSHELNLTITKLNKPERLQVWVSCDGLLPSDREAIGSISHTPPGFPEYYFPYVNNKNYLSPLVAVKIHKPRPNVLITIECRAWAKNIQYHGGIVHRQGSVRFELLIDAPQNINPTKVLKGIRKSHNAISSEEGLRNTEAPKISKGIRHSHNAISSEKGLRDTETPRGSKGVRHSHNAISGEERADAGVTKGGRTLNSSHNKFLKGEYPSDSDALKESKEELESYNAISGEEVPSDADATRGGRIVNNSGNAVSEEVNPSDTDATKGPRGIRKSDITSLKEGSTTDRTHGSVSTTDRTQGAGPTTDRTQGAGPTTDRTQGSGSTTDRTQGAGPTTDRTQGSGSTTDRTRGAGPTTDRTQGSGSTTDRTRGAGPTTDRTQGSGSTTDRTQGAGPTTDRTQGAGPTTDRTQGSGSTTDRTKGSEDIRKSRKARRRRETSGHSDEMKGFRGKPMSYRIISGEEDPTDTDATRGPRGIRKSYNAIPEREVSSMTTDGTKGSRGIRKWYIKEDHIASDATKLESHNSRLREETSRSTYGTKGYSGIRQLYYAFSREGPRDTDATKGSRGMRKSYNTVSGEEGPKIPMQPKFPKAYVSYTVQYNKEM